MNITSKTIEPLKRLWGIDIESDALTAIGWHFDHDQPMITGPYALDWGRVKQAGQMPDIPNWQPHDLVACTVPSLWVQSCDLTLDILDIQANDIEGSIWASLPLAMRASDQSHSMDWFIEDKHNDSIVRVYCAERVHIDTYREWVLHAQGIPFLALPAHLAGLWADQDFFMPFPFEAASSSSIKRAWGAIVAAHFMETHDEIASH